MDTSSELAVYRRLFGERYVDLVELLADLPAAALVWRPFENSPWQGPAGQLGWLVAHAISSTYYLLRRAEYSLGRLDWAAVDGDEGPEEFGPANHDPAYLRARAERMHGYIAVLLGGLTSADLDATRPHPTEPERLLSARYDIVHALEHLSQHLGHAQLTRQLWALEDRGNEVLSALGT